MSTKINKTAKGTFFDFENRLAGGFGMASAKQSNIQLLRRLTLANLLWEDNAYVDGESTDKQIMEMIPLCDGKDVAGLAIECRVHQKMRHTPLRMICEMVKYKDHKQYVSEIIPLICTRVDMLMDLVSIYWKDGRKPLPASFKKGIAKALLQFNEYSLAKYRGDTKEVKLRDVMFLCHPKPLTPEQAMLFKKVADNTLETPNTWEVALSSGKDKKETWTRLIKDNALGGLAMLRNLRNMRDAEVDRHVISAGIEATKTAMLLPLDYYKTARLNPEFKREIEKLMYRSYANNAKLPGRSLIVLDISGSMGQSMSSKSDFSRLDAGLAMVIAAINLCENYELVCTAGNDSSGIGKHEHVKYPATGFDLIPQLQEVNRRIGSGGIFTRQCLEWCNSNIEGDFDRIVVFSDSADCDKKDKRPKPYGKNNYIVDVSSHKHGINYKGVWTAEISGWSGYFLTYIAALEGLENAYSE